MSVEEKGLKFTFERAFYNRKAETARGLGVLAARVASVRSIFEAFAGGGVRTALYLKYVNPDNHHVNEGNRQYMCEALFNLWRNGIRTDNLKITVSDFLKSWREFVCERYDWVDLDPFGSPSPYLVGGLALAREKGYIYITSTDMATLAGKRKEGKRLYGVTLKPWKAFAEIGARALIYTTWLSANFLNLRVEPIFIYYEGYAYRLLVRIKDKRDAKGVGFAQRCSFCGTYSVSEEPKSTCGVCGGENVIVGPIWIGHLYDRVFLREMAGEAERLNWKDEYRALIKMLEEIDEPLYYTLDEFHLGKVPPLRRVIEALKDMGFEASRTQFHSNAVKTNASRPQILMAMR